MSYNSLHRAARNAAGADEKEEDIAAAEALQLHVESKQWLSDKERHDLLIRFDMDWRAMNRALGSRKAQAEADLPAALERLARVQPNPLKWPPPLRQYYDTTDVLVPPEEGQLLLPAHGGGRPVIVDRVRARIYSGPLVFEDPHYITSDPSTLRDIKHTISPDEFAAFPWHTVAKVEYIGHYTSIELIMQPGTRPYKRVRLTRSYAKRSPYYSPPLA